MVLSAEPNRARHALASHGADASRSDCALLSQVASGDHEAFAALYDRLGGAAYGLARRVVSNPALADEATQEAFLNVWLTAATFDPSRGTARAWIMTIVHRRAVDTVRRELTRRRRLRPAALVVVDREYDVVLEDVLQRASARAADNVITRALTALTPLQREAVDLGYFQGFTCAEVADLLNVPLSTAKTRMRDALIRLAAEVRPHV